MLTNMEYQRQKRMYQVVDPDSGEIEQYPSGTKGRQQALRRAVYFQNARLHNLVTQLIERYPLLESRAWRASTLVLNDAVNDVRDGAVLATVTGNSEYGPYLIQSRQGLLTCECLDYVDGGAPYLGSNGQRVCKHILAMQFIQRLQFRICGSCSQKVDEQLMTCPMCNGPVTPF